MAEDYGPVKIGARLPLNVVEGVPQCPCCQEPAVEVAPGRWQCQIGVIVYGNLAAAVGAAIDEFLAARAEGPS